jgi:ATP-binding cassette, subfamily B, multidrug efflux pump
MEKKQATNKKTVEKKDQLGQLKRTMSYVTPYWQFWVLILVFVATAIFDVMTPSIIGDIINMIGAIGGGTLTGGATGSMIGWILNPLGQWVSTTYNYEVRYATLLVFVLSLIAVAGSVAVLNYIARYGNAWISQRGSYIMRSDLYNSLLKQDFSFYDKQRTGQLMARATGDIDQIQRFFDFGLRQIVSTSLLIVLTLWQIFGISFWLSLVTMVIFPFIYYTMLLFGQKSFPITQKMRQQYGEITSVFQENLMGIKVIRGFAQEKQEQIKIEKELQNYFGLHLETAKYRAVYLPLATFITTLGFVIILWYGGNQVISGVLSLGAFIAFYFYILRLSQPVRMLGQISNLALRSNAASSRVFEIIDLDVEVHDKPDAVELKNSEGHVEFRDVSFGYDGKNMVLKNINLDVKPGMNVAILGATGSGKSSIINLIPRFYDVNRGVILIDGIDVRNYKIKSVREQVGIVRQDPFIFSTTFKENIAYGVENATMEEIELAAKEAKIHDYIVSLPRGYDEEIGERGVTVSGGQKQRIAIARALLKNPKILILDDSTSSVDTQTEHDIQQALDELLTNRTTFIITQRLSSVKKADYIVVLDDGEIAEEGTHDDLMIRDGIYRRLYETQTTGGARREAK